MDEQEVERLRARVAELERYLGLSFEAEPAVPVVLRCTPSEGRVLQVLMNAKLCSRDMLLEAIDAGQRKQRDKHIVEVLVTRLRRRLADHHIAIVTVRGRGWKLLSGDQLKLREMVEQDKAAA